MNSRMTRAAREEQPFAYMQLPYEITTQIAEMLPLSSLKQLSLCSKTVCGETVVLAARLRAIAASVLICSLVIIAQLAVLFKSIQKVFNEDETLSETLPEEVAPSVRSAHFTVGNVLSGSIANSQAFTRLLVTVEYAVPTARGLVRRRTQHGSDECLCATPHMHASAQR